MSGRYTIAFFFPFFSFIKKTLLRIYPDYSFSLYSSQFLPTLSSPSFSLTRKQQALETIAKHDKQIQWSQAKTVTLKLVTQLTRRKESQEQAPGHRSARFSVRSPRDRCAEGWAKDLCRPCGLCLLLQSPELTCTVLCWLEGLVLLPSSIPSGS